MNDKGEFLNLKVFVEFNCVLRPGETRNTEKFLVAHSESVSEDIKAWALKRSENVTVLTKKRPAVFCTWYYYELNVTYENVNIQEDCMKRAVVYYSLSENTKEAASVISGKIGAELIRIDVVKEMPKSFSGQIMYGGMQATFGLKPAITGVPEDILSYDEIIIGTPVWAGKHSPAINSFIAMDGVAEKITGAIILSGGGENKNCVPGLKKLLPNLKNVLELSDKKLNKTEENEAKIADFVEKM